MGSEQDAGDPTFVTHSGPVYGIGASGSLTTVSPANFTAPGRAPGLPPHSLHAQAASLPALRGHPVLLTLWASWCQPCRREAPELARCASRGPGTRLVGIDTADDAAKARRFVKRFAWCFPVLRDAGSSYADAYGVDGLPTTFVLDTRGRIARALSGPQTATSLEQAFDAAR